MTDRLSHKRKFIIIITAVLLLLAAVLFFLMKPWMSQAQREDYRQISSQEFDTVFLSMYPIDTYHEEDFSYYRGMSLFKASYCIPKFSVMEQYMKEIAKSGNTVTTVYLGIRPDKADLSKIQSLVSQYPGVTFEVILAYPSAAYWKNLSEEAYEKTLEAYCDFLSAIPNITDANFYFMASQEWLINNPSNYENEWLAAESAARTIMLHSDRNHEYLVTDAKVPSLILALKELTGKIRTGLADFPDLSDTCLVFFGDSIIAGYNDSNSIPGTVAGRTGAAVYNCGYGGNSAAMGPETLISLPGIVEAFFQGDLSVLPEGKQVYSGIASYWSDPPGNSKLCFVINYGSNDYFEGFPISSEDPYDIATYCGAIRTAVKSIRQNAPDAQIILCTPPFTASFQNGAEPHGDAGNVLADYVDAVLALSTELRTDILDNYHELGITRENHGQYLEDGVHPNAACRYLIGTNLIRLIR